MENRRHLYHARINARLTLEQIGIRTALSPTVLRNIDEGRYELLPSGLYARSYVRTFAVAVGLDPDVALAQVEALLPHAPDPVPALNAARGFNGHEHVKRWILALSIRLRTLASACDPRALPLPSIVFSRLRAEVDRVKHLAPPTIRRPQFTRYAAASIDAAVLLVVDAFVLLLVSWTCGIPARALVHDAATAIVALSAIPAVLYFVLFGGITGTTIGRWMCGVASPPLDHPLTLPDILRRAAFH